MQMPLVATKLYFPPARPVLVARPRLVERLQAGLTGPLTLLSAPAGSGKTTLLSEWRAGPGMGHVVAWVSLGAEDNDLTRFLLYLSAALSHLQAGASDEVQPLLQAADRPIPEAVLTLLVNRLSALQRESVLVLDDYHLIELPAIHQAMTFLLDHLPPHLHLVLLTRSDPALPLARLRARGQLAEIRAEHLRFTPQEASEFLKQVMGLSLTDEQVATLERRTEGWIAGLQLAALSLQNCKDVKQFVSDFTGSHHYIVDFLAEDVLGRQPEMLREFLQRTSILERLSGPLCDALLGTADGAAVLEALDHANLFVVPLDEDRRWFRYHHLFADLLRSRLFRIHPELVADLHLRASAWFEANAFPDEAIGHALEAKDFERAARLMERSLLAISGQGRMATVVRWVSALPDAFVASRPRLGLSLAWALYFELKFDEAEACLLRVESRLPAEEAPRYLGELALWHGILARRHGDVERSRDFLLQALEHIPAENPALRGRALIFLGLGYLECDMPRALEALGQAGEMFTAANSAAGLLPALYFLAWAQSVQGKLSQAAQTSQRALECAGAVSHWPAASYAHLAMAEFLWARNELDAAAQHAARGMALAELGGHTDNLLIATLDTARIERARGKWDKAQALLAQAAGLARPTIPWVKVQVAHERVLLCLATGKVAEAKQWLLQNMAPPQFSTGIPELQARIIWARFRVARRQFREALAELTPLQAQAEALELWHAAIQIHCLQALARHALGQEQEAVGQLKAALTLAEPEGSIRVFLDEGIRMSELLHLAQDRGLAPELVSALIQALGEQPAARTIGRPLAPGRLSRRQVELLRLIAEGHSNKEIAAILTISIGTVKRHTVNIFNKLDVKNRTEAVAKARELGLL